jgi:hypothetical protein
MHDSPDRQVNLAPGLRHPDGRAGSYWRGQIADYGCLLVQLAFAIQPRIWSTLRPVQVPSP